MTDRTPTWTGRYFVRAATLRDALPRARDRAAEDHADTPRDAMMTPSFSARYVAGKLDIVYGYDVTVIGKPRENQPSAAERKAVRHYNGGIDRQKQP